MCSECARLLAVLLAFDSPTAGDGKELSTVLTPGTQEGKEEEEEEGLQEERGRSFQPTFGLYHEP